jgi:hypothetical protein
MLLSNMGWCTKWERSGKVMFFSVLFPTQNVFFYLNIRFYFKLQIRLFKLFIFLREIQDQNNYYFTFYLVKKKGRGGQFFLN